MYTCLHTITLVVNLFGYRLVLGVLDARTLHQASWIINATNYSKMRTFIHSLLYTCLCTPLYLW